MSQRPIRAADLFCGSGGFSTGLVRACEKLFPGRPLDLVAVNHWQVAIDTHQRNHPEVRHFCADLEHLKPLDAVPGGVLDILLAAPACTYHSRARGGKPVYDQQRMDPWHVVRWCTELRVHRLIVENVPEFIDWGPCHAVTGKPIKARRGEYFRAWVQALKAIGMRVDWKVQTCANFGDATTRERFFLYGRSDKQALRWPEPTHARGGHTDLLGTLKPWRPAAEIIDWSRPGSSIFTRKRPLVKNTLTRLRAGAERNRWPQQHIDALQALIDGETPRLQVTAEEAVEIASRLGIPLVMATGGGGTARGVDCPLPTMTAGGEGGATPHFAEPVVMGTLSNATAKGVHRNPVPTILNARPHLAEPIILHKMNSDGGRSARGIGEPVPTVTTNGAGWLARPIITPYYGGGSGLTGRSADEPLPAQGTKERFAVASPTIFRVNQGHGRTRGITSGAEPVPTLTASESLGVATPFLTAYHGPKREGDDRVHDLDEPLGTQTTENRFGLALPFLVPNFGERPGQTPRTHAIDDPLPTVAAGGHIQLAEPFVTHITHHDTSLRARGVREPLPTITGANRGELALAAPFLTGFDGPAQPPLADGFYIDILYRMLHWTELARATSFEDGDYTYEFSGTATEITKQIGNAVPIRTATALCAALLAA